MINLCTTNNKIYIRGSMLQRNEKIPVELLTVWKRYGISHNPSFQPCEVKDKGSYVGAIYKDQDGTRWLGKIGGANDNLPMDKFLPDRSIIRRGANWDATKEKIASDFYYLLALESGQKFIAPETLLANLPIINQFTQNNPLANAILDEINYGRENKKMNAIHIMSKWMDGYTDLANASVKNSDGNIIPYFEHFQNTGILSDTIIVDGKEIPLEGLLELLAAARLLGDIDVFGNSGGNVGFVLIPDQQGKPEFAQIVKIDPGYAFTVNGQSQLFAALNPSASPDCLSLKDLKDIQIGTTSETLVQWSCLTQNQKTRFINAMKKYIDTLKDESIIHFMFNRNNEFSSTTDHSLMPNNHIEYYKLALRCLTSMQETSYKDLFQNENSIHMLFKPADKAIPLSPDELKSLIVAGEDWLDGATIKLPDFDMESEIESFTMLDDSDINPDARKPCIIS